MTDLVVPGLLPWLTVNATRDLEFSAAKGRTVSSISLLDVLRAAFSLLAPERPLPKTSRFEDHHRSNWGTDEVYFTAEGDGVLIATRCNGAVAGEDLSAEYHLTVGDRIHMFASRETEYEQTTYVVRVRGTDETIDVATDALLHAAGAAGLRLVLRDDAPGPIPKANGR